VGGAVVRAGDGGSTKGGGAVPPAVTLTSSTPVPKALLPDAETLPDGPPPCPPAPEVEGRVLKAKAAAGRDTVGVLVPASAPLCGAQMSDPWSQVCAVGSRALTGNCKNKSM
jgi:hypothetical protein